MSKDFCGKLVNKERQVDHEENPPKTVDHKVFAKTYISAEPRGHVNHESTYVDHESRR